MNEVLLRWPELEYRNKGRNGLVASHGVSVADFGPGTIALHGINSRGDVSDAARILIHKESVPELVNALNRMIVGPLGLLALDAEKKHDGGSQG